MKCLNAMLLLCLLAAANMARAGTCTTITPQLSTLSVGTITCSAMRLSAQWYFLARRQPQAPILPGVLIR